MAKKRAPNSDPVLAKLDAIHSSIQDLLIIQARMAGIRKAEARAIIGVAASRVTRIWREIHTAGEE